MNPWYLAQTRSDRIELCRGGHPLIVLNGREWTLSDVVSVEGDWEIRDKDLEWIADLEPIPEKEKLIELILEELV